MERGRIGVVLAMTAAWAFAAGCGPQIGCQIDTRVVRQTDKVIEIEWTFRNTMGVPVWVPAEWSYQRNEKDPLTLPVAFAVLPDSLLFMAGDFCWHGDARAKVFKETLERAYGESGRSVEADDDEKATTRPTHSNMTPFSPPDVNFTKLGPGQCHTYRAVLHLPYVVQRHMASPYCSIEEVQGHSSDVWAEDQVDYRPKSETLPKEARRVWLGVEYYLADRSQGAVTGDDGKPLTLLGPEIHRWQVTKNLIEGEVWAKTLYGDPSHGVSLVSVRYASSRPLEMTIPLKVEKWQYDSVFRKREPPGLFGKDE